MENKFNFLSIWMTKEIGMEWNGMEWNGME
jgi:hypothetical protein